MSGGEDDSMPTAGSSSAEGEYYVEKILGHMKYRKAIKLLNPPITEFNPPCYSDYEHCKWVFHVKWLNYDNSHNTWEVEDNLVGNEQYKKYKKKNGLAKGVERVKFWVKDLIANAGGGGTRSSSSASLRGGASAKGSRESSLARNSARNPARKSNDGAPKAIHSMFLTKEEKEELDKKRYKEAGKKEAARLQQDDTLEELEKQLKRKKALLKNPFPAPSRDPSPLKQPSKDEKQKKKNKAVTDKEREVRSSREFSRPETPEQQPKRKTSLSKERSPPSSPIVVRKPSTSAYDLFGDDIRVKKKKREEAPPDPPKKISFSQREKEMDALRTKKKATATAALYSNADIFDRGSGSPSASKKRPVEPEPQVERAELLPRAMQPTKIKSGKRNLSEEDRAKIDRMRAEDQTGERKKKKEREEMEKKKEREDKEKKKEREEIEKKKGTEKLLPPVSSLPRIKKKSLATSVPPLKIIPKVPPLRISKAKTSQSSPNVMDSILAEITKTIHSPSTLPSSTGPQSSESVIKSRSDLMLKSTKKQKKSLKIPSFNYSANRSRSSVSSEPMEVDNSPMEDDVVVDVAPQETVVSESQHHHKTSAPEPVVEEEEEEPIRLIRQLRTKVYPLYRSALLKDLGLLRKFSKTTDDLSYDQWRKEARVWKSFDQIAMAMYRCIRAEVPEVLDMHLLKNSLRVTMTWDPSSGSWKLPSGDTGEKAAKCLQKNELPAELKTPLPADFETKFGEKLVLRDVSNPPPNNNNADEKKAEPAKVKEKNPYVAILSDRLMKEYRGTGVAAMSFLESVIEAYTRMDHKLMTDALTPCTSSLWRFRFIKEVLKSVPPKGRKDPNPLWLVEADGCDLSTYWNAFDKCQKGHGKCNMLRALLGLLPEKLRFHSQSPFRPEVFLHCFKFGGHCQKVLFLDAGAPFCLTRSLEYQSSEDETYAFDHFGVLLSQRHPRCILDMLKRGLCVNSLSMRKVPAFRDLKPFTCEPIFVEEFLSAMSEAGVTQFDDEEWTEQLVGGLKAFANRLHTYVGGRLVELGQALFPTYTNQALLTPVHTLCSVGPSHTANVFVYLDGVGEWDIFETEEHTLQPLMKESIEKVENGEAVIMIAVFRIEFIGGLGKKTVQPVTPVSSSEECTPSALRLVDPDAGTPRPCITIDAPMTSSNSDEWVFKIDSSNSHKLEALVGARMRVSLATEGEMGTKFLLQMVLLSN